MVFTSVVMCDQLHSVGFISAIEKKKKNYEDKFEF